MKKRIFITATNTDIGKTYTTKLLMRVLTKMGYKVGVIKPIETGVTSNEYPDGDALLSLLKQLNPQADSLDVSDVVPVAYEIPAAPYVAGGFSRIDYGKIDAAIKNQEILCDVLLIEGAGGLYVPIDKDRMMIDLIKQFDATAILVTHCSLGCINDTLIHKKALDDMLIPNEIVFNCRDEEIESFEAISKPYFAKVFPEVFTTKELEKLAVKMGFSL
ncbi:MAG: dethiobiotin synthase [Epsilonproteobacteria bacterium]|nr:dethiobiotin synthase [Campylobacterota bacterium]